MTAAKVAIMSVVETISSQRRRSRQLQRAACVLWKTLPDPDRPIVFISGGTGALALRSGKWKLIEGQGNRGYGEMRQKKPWPKPSPGAPPHQLYNLDENLGESTNLYAGTPRSSSDWKRRCSRFEKPGTSEPRRHVRRNRRGFFGGG